LYVKLREELLIRDYLIFLDNKNMFAMIIKKCSVKIILIEEIANGMTDKYEYL